MNYLLRLLNVLKEEVSNIWNNIWNDPDPKLNYPNGSLYEAFLNAVKRFPRYKAYVYYGKIFYYSDLNKQIIKCARGLKQLGVKKGDSVTICMPNTPDAIIMFYAVNAVGGIANMIHPLSSEQEIMFYLNKSNSCYLLCLDSIYPTILNILNITNVKTVIISKVTNKMPFLIKFAYNFTKKPTKINYDDKVFSWKKLNKEGKKYRNGYIEEVKKNEDAVILYSGGTTGDPKGVVLSNFNFNALATQCFNMVDPAKAGDSVLCIMPIFHGFGLGVSVHTELINGMNIILIPRFNVKEFSKLIKKYKPRFLIGVPTMYEALVNSKEKSKKYLKCVGTAICGGDILNETLRSRVDTYLKSHGSKANIRVGYGLTECTAASCVTPRYYYKEGGIGYPMPDMEYKIININSKKECSKNEDGEICISGPTVMKRYLDDYKETKKTLIKHSDGKIWLHTGDVGCINEEGLVFFKSRIKRIIVSSGYNIYPQYIEKILMTHQAILTCIVISVPHPYKKQVPKAYIVLRDNYDETNELKEDIINHCKKYIAKYALPYEYEYVKSLPKTKVGKVNFKELSVKNKKLTR